MHKDDTKALLESINGIIWLIRAIATLILLLVLYLALFPLQIILWLASNNRFVDIEPYRFLRYLFVKGTAFPGELPISNLSYKEWKANPPP